MKTDALIEMRNHAEANLWPFPDRMQHLDTSEFDFNTEVSMFESNLAIVFRELKDNIIECPKEDAQKYAGHVIEILQEARKQVNQFFGHDTPEGQEYNNRLQQMEAEGVKEDPPSGLTPADSINPDKLEYPPIKVAVYFNMVCLFWYGLFNAFTSKEEDIKIELPELETISQIVLLLNETGIYEYIYTNVFSGNKERTATLISAITGRPAKSIKTAIQYLNRPNDPASANPYTISAMNKVALLLDMLQLDSKKLNAILSSKLSDSKKEK